MQRQDRPQAIYRELEESGAKKYYLDKPCEFKVTIEDDGFTFEVEPRIKQPTADGANIIASHYNNKYGINIRIVDHSEKMGIGTNINKRFDLFIRSTISQTLIENNRPIGFLLMHKMNHAVPVIVSRENDKLFMIILDSNSGCRKRGYYTVANHLPEFTVLLNNGTRQADNGSCVTDGLCILKDGLRAQQLGHSLLDEKVLPASSHDRSERSAARTLFSSTPSAPNLFTVRLVHDNFHVFRMPEFLLKSAQISNYLVAAEAHMGQIIGKLEKNETLGQRRERDKKAVSINKKDSPTKSHINSYLYKKSHRHATIIDELTERSSPQR